MNIRQAKEQIKNAMIAYFTKDELGNYAIPIEKQRPILLIGPPGLGKTAIMEQVAAELGVGLVSYSMTHHTRQSALGLPFIAQKEFEGYEYSVSEYTMSEIIGSLYDLMRETDVRQGILFLDEINCVSETLAPCMLQFLQYKTFGQHKLPQGWIVVTAGNPPEYNKSVRDFDIVTWDRLKKVVVEPDYNVWKEYASSKGVHPAVLTYLSARKKDFYKVETTVDGKQFVTARGWDDLSEMIKLYEKNSLPVDELLIGQYIQSPRIAKDFAVYYDLFRKYRSDYRIDAILDGQAGEDILFRAQRAQMDERVSFLSLLFDAVVGELRNACEQEDMLDQLMPALKRVKLEIASGKDPLQAMEAEADALHQLLVKGQRASSLSINAQRACQRAAMELETMRGELIRDGVAREAIPERIGQDFAARVAKLSQLTDRGHAVLDHAFAFCEAAFEAEDAEQKTEIIQTGGDELLLFVTELTVNYYAARFIGHFGCDRYYMHNKELQFEQRRMEIEQRVNALNWDL